jgi:hypothetical protein
MMRALHAMMALRADETSAARSRVAAGAAGLIGGAAAVIGAMPRSSIMTKRAPTLA